MQYDSLGFPIPPGFDAEPDGTTAARRRQPGRPGRGKRLVIAAILGLVLPAVLVPAILPTIREEIAHHALERAVAHEGRGRVGAAIRSLDRAIFWLGAADEREGRLLCWRATLRLADLDSAGALADADRAAALAPTSGHPQRVRALALAVRGEWDASLVAARTAADLAGPDNPEGLNHLAYMRALAGRELEAALADVERALEGSGDATPEYLDTRGFILHLLGRQQEAIDDLNRAIDGGREQRRRLTLLAGQAHPDEVAFRLRSVDQGLAVMHHHRALACRALGLDGQADQDAAVAREKGFDPARGVL